MDELNFLGYPALREISELKENWDSYGGKPIRRECLEHALWLLKAMPNWWTPVPCSDGSIQLERHAGGMDFELLISVAHSANAPP
jgi:hypothetical protein